MNEPQKTSLGTLEERKFTLRQKGSAIRCTERQRQTLKGLGLRHVGHVRVLKYTPSIYGMFLKVAHIVEILPQNPV